jgi:flagellar hook-length control protein FliK
VPRPEAEAPRGAPGLERAATAHAAHTHGTGGPDGSTATTEARDARAAGTQGPDPFQQVADRALKMVRMGDRDATLRLVPDHLGEVRIHITVDRGTVTADITAHNHLARHLLESHQGRLQQALLDGGADGARVSVSLGGEQAAQSDADPRGRDSQAFREPVDTVPEPEAPEPVAATPAPAASEGALSIRA